MSTTFNTFDLIFLAMSLLFVVVAFFRGFVKELASLIIWIIALCACHFLSPLLAKALSSYSSNKIILELVSRFMIFIVTFFTLLLSTSTLVGEVKEKMPALLDRSLGIFYGIVKSVLIFGIFYSVTANLYTFLLGDKNDPTVTKVPQWMEDARFSKIMHISASIVDPAVQSFMNQTIKSFDKSGVLPQTLDSKIDEVIDEKINKGSKDLDFQARGDESSTKKRSNSSVNYDEEKNAKEIEKETGYDKKNIDKLGRLIDVIDKTN